MSSSMNNTNTEAANPGSRRCAACKNQRRKCSQDCVLAPYFPATDPQRYACVQRIFGASNIARMLQSLLVHERGKAADTMVMEAYRRVQDPVYGCAGVIARLQDEIRAVQSELARTQALLAVHAAAAGMQHLAAATQFNAQQIERLARTDSDFAAFLHHAGIPCVDLYYGKEFPGYHTALDSFNWMERHGDPLFLRHLAITEIWGLLALRLADDPVLRFDYQTYASQIQEHTHAFSVLMNDCQLVNLMNGCISDLSRAAMGVLEEAKKLVQLDLHDEYTIMRRRLLNDRLLLAERSFLQAEGLQGREWFKHLVYSPPEDYESKLSFFPGIADAISRPGNRTVEERQVALKHEMWKISRAIQRAASVLSGELSQR